MMLPQTEEDIRKREEKVKEREKRKEDIGGWDYYYFIGFDSFFHYGVALS